MSFFAPKTDDPPSFGGTTAKQRGALPELALLRGLLAQVPTGIGILSGPEHRWTYINEAHVRLTGATSAEEFLGKTFLQSLPELAAQGFSTILDKVYQTGEPYFGHEIKMKLNRAGASGREEAYFEIVFQPMRTAEGKVEAILVHTMAIENKTAAREAIEVSLQRTELAQASGQIGTWEWDPVEDEQALSPELHRLFGTDPSNRVRQEWESRVYPDDWPQVQELMQEGFVAGTMEFEYRYLHPENGLRWFYCKGLRRAGETRMLGIVQDVTARKSAAETSQRLAAIVEFSNDAIVGKDLNGIVTSWNRSAERIFGFTAAEMIGQPILKIIPRELWQDETTILSTIARGERIEHFETIRLHKNGSRIEVSLTVSPIKDESGKTVGAAKIARDITQIKRAEHALRTSEKLASVGRLAATVAHEINNPLEAITNLIYLAKNATDSGEVREYLASAEEEMERVFHITKQTLGFYRETKGAATVRLGSLVTSLLPVFSSRIRNKGIKVLPEIRDDSELCAVPGEIRQVAANLLNNSIDALEHGGRIRVRVSRGAQWRRGRRPGIRLTVADTGSGIPREARSKLFEPFFTTKKDTGTGLGLWVCRSIVENHGGSIQVRSSRVPGRSWTVFSIFLPLGPLHPADEI